MKKYLIIIIIAILSIPCFVFAAYPDTLSSWVMGNKITSSWANALESKIGINNSTTTSSLDYKVNDLISSTTPSSIRILNNLTNLIVTKSTTTNATTTNLSVSGLTTVASLSASGSITSGQITSNAVIAGAGLGVTGLSSTASAIWALKGANSGATKIYLNNSDSLLTAGNSGSGLFLFGRFSEASSGNHPLITSAGFKPIIIDTGAATVSNTSSLYLEGAATTTTVTGKNYSLWVDDVGGGGTSLIDGLVLLASSTNSNVGIGSSTPSSKLSVNGNAYIVGTTTLDNVLIQNGKYSHFGNTPTYAGTCAGYAGSCLEIIGNDNTLNGVAMQIANVNAGTDAYAGLNLNNDISDANALNYAGLYLNSSKYTSTSFGTGINLANQLQVQNSMGAVTLVSSTSTTNSMINFLVGGSATTSEIMRISSTGKVGIGTTTPLANFQVTASTSNATTSVSFGKVGQNKGTCITYYNTAGTAIYMYFVGTTPTYTASKPSGCTD